MKIFRVTLHLPKVPKHPNPLPQLLRPVSYKVRHIHGPVHVLYFGLVAWEVSKMYALAAAVLAVVELARILSGEHEEH